MATRKRNSARYAQDSDERGGGEGEEREGVSEQASEQVGERRSVREREIGGGMENMWDSEQGGGSVSGRL